MRNAARTLRFTITLMLLLTAGSAVAQTVSENDRLGMYFDAGGVSMQLSSAPLYTQITICLLLTRPTATTPIDDWECALSTQPDPMPGELTVTLAGEGVNSTALPNYRVSIASPLTPAPAVVLATLQTLNFGVPSTFYFRASSPSVFPSAPLPAYHVSGETDWRATPGCFPRTPPGTYLGCCLNYYCISLPTEQSAWSCREGAVLMIRQSRSCAREVPSCVG